MAANISKQLASIAKRANFHFTLKGRPLPHAEVFADTGLLPGLIRRAEQLSSLCLGYGLGAPTEDAEGTLMGVRVKFDDFTPDILRVFCIVDVIYELAKTSPSRDEIPLDELLYD